MFYLCVMPVISMFYGIVIMMFYMDNKKHKHPHIHAGYQGKMSVFAIPSGKLLAGSIPANKRKLVEAWIEIHNAELMKDWELAVNGTKPNKIQPLK
jgi:hypothetical protein